MIFIRLLTALIFIAVSTVAHAQTSPGWPTGFVPSMSQWNAAFAGKRDYVPAGTAYYVTTNQIPSRAFAGATYYFGAPAIFTLPSSTFIPPDRGFTVNALGGDITIALGSSTDVLQTNPTGVGFTLSKGSWAIFTTDGAGHWYYSQSSMMAGGVGNAIIPPNLIAGRALIAGGGINIAAAPAPPDLDVPTVQQLQGWNFAGVNNGTVFTVDGYYAVRDMPRASYTYSTSPCQLGGGAGDGFSQLGTTSGTCIDLMPETVYDVRQAGITVGGTDTGGQNASQFNAMVAYAATVGNGGTIDLGGNTVGLSGGTGIVINVGSSSPTIQNGLIVCASTCGVAGAGSYVNHTYWVNSGPVTVPVWTPPQPFTGTKPVGLVNYIAGGFPLLRNLTVDCLSTLTCADIVASGGGLRLDHLILQGQTTYGLAYSGSLNADSITIGGYTANPSDVTKWVGYGAYCAPGLGSTAPDNTLTHVNIHGTYRGFYTACGDTKFVSGHIFPAPVGPSDWEAIVFDIGTNSNAVISNNTFDNSRIIIQVPNGSGNLPQIEFIGNIFEFGHGGVVDGSLVLKCMGSSRCGPTTTALSNFLLSAPLPDSDGGNNLQAYYPIALEDQFGNLNPDAFTNQLQVLWGSGNGCSYACANVPYQNTTPQGAQFTFTADITTGSLTLANATILPVQGTIITDTGGCIGASAQISDISYTLGQSSDGTQNGQIWYSTPNPSSGNCPGDTIHVGSLTLTGRVQSTPQSIDQLNLPPFALNEILTDSAGCLSGFNFWISGYNEHTGQVIINQAGGHTPSCTHAGDVFTVTPFNYVPAPFDSGSMLIANASVNTIFYLRDDIGRGWFSSLSPRNGAGSLSLSLLGSATINNMASGVTLFGNSFSTTPLTVASGGPSRYEIDATHGLTNQEMLTLTGFGAGVAPTLIPAAPQSTNGFSIDVGTTAGNHGTINFSINAPTGWSCGASNTTTPTNNISQTASTRGSAQLTNYLAGVATNFVDHANLTVQCSPF